VLDPSAQCTVQDILMHGLPMIGSGGGNTITNSDYVDVLQSVKVVGSPSDCVIVSVGRAWLLSDVVKEAFSGDCSSAALHRVVWQHQQEHRHSIPFLVDLHPL
jgi:hypothetical protein